MVLNLKIKGHYRLYVNGKHVASSDNLVLDNGLTMMSNGVGLGLSPVLCVGSSATAANSAQTSLLALMAQEDATGPTLGAGSSRQWSASFTGMSGIIREIGFGRSTTDLFSRSVITAVIVTPSDVVSVTYSVSTVSTADLTTVETGHAIFTDSTVTWTAESINDADIIGLVIGMILTGDVPEIIIDHMRDSLGFEYNAPFAQVLEWDTVPNDFGDQSTVGFTTSRRMGIFHVVGMDPSLAVRITLIVPGYGLIRLRSDGQLSQEPNPPDFAHTITVNFSWESA